MTELGVFTSFRSESVAESLVEKGKNSLLFVSEAENRGPFVSCIGLVASLRDR